MQAKEIAELLEKSDFFGGLDAEHRDWLAEHASETRFEDGQLVARHGDTADRFFLVLDGELVVEVPALTGPTLEVTRLGPGKIFGWSWLIEPYRWHFNARAAGPTRVLDFDGLAILKRAEDEPKFGYALLRRFSALMGTRLESAQRKMMDQWSPAGLP
ncbi:cyclic nucleotide-binding domain-containing protein [Wenzhouxiangella sediminis]|uniref:Cyclic nucleotide-binding domain-containing protein n=1 Tax=Wenzhouxiangella sediminis TaxID=1792836 RepID=A0A3E1KC58_9GAMM|nr:cyclic nucleotide-binding domain-containing protein [Wenzhouxiangella sediminis]RFF32316.1 cyclic nucleotide-binding domain-containing protein [Wenzhouxiangella sediminis]